MLHFPSFPSPPRQLSARACVAVLIVVVCVILVWQFVSWGREWDALWEWVGEKAK